MNKVTNGQVVLKRRTHSNQKRWDKSTLSAKQAIQHEQLSKMKVKGYMKKRKLNFFGCNEIIPSNFIVSLSKAF